MSINKVALSGNITRDVDLRQTASGSAILVFGIAVNERIKRGDDWEDYPNFFDCVMFGRRAESLSKIMRKGMKVALSGRLRYSSWENKDGQRRSKVEVIAEEVELMQRRSDGDGQHGGNQEVPDGYPMQDVQRMAGGNVNYAENYASEDYPF